MPAPGTLFIVATPIGNLEDITLRAIRVLKEVDLVAAEDTRRTLKLLSHLGISKPLVSVREHNETRESARLVQRMLAGASIAYVSDAGTPGIADPGARLVATARSSGVAVRAVPGPSAVAAVMSVSGHSGVEFTFMGFPPASGPARSEWFERLASEERAVVFFESPHRVSATLREIVGLDLVNRQILINKEITKINEQFVVQPTRNAGVQDPRGEFTLVVVPGPHQATPDRAEDLVGAVGVVKLLLTTGGLPLTQAVKAAGAAFGLKPARILNAVKKDKILAKRQNVDWP